jgi:surfactin synthase thioesterase subunit
MATNLRASAADPGRWFRRFGASSGARRRLICFHHAGGSASLFSDWHRHVTSATEVWAVALPGRETRLAETPVDRMETLAALLVEVLPLDLPFAFFGHSLGAVIGFELARQLRMRGLPEPAHLFVSACLAPQLCLQERSRATLSDAELLHALESFGGTPKELLEYPDYLAMVLSVLRADFNLIDRYMAPEGSELRFRITAYAGTADPHVPPDLMRAWERWAMPGFTCRSFAGDHFYLNARRAALIGDLLANWNTDGREQAPQTRS